MSFSSKKAKFSKIDLLFKDSPLSLLNSVGGVGGVGQTLAWVTWVCKILGWVKKMAWVAWIEILAWVAWVHKIGVGPNFGIGQKNGLYQNKIE